MTLTLRKARRKLGTRSTRRRGTNGKNIHTFPARVKGEAPRPAPLGNSGRVIYKYKNPRPASRKVAVGVRKLLNQRPA